MDQILRFARTRDGGRLAYATYSQASGFPLVYMPSWFSQEHIWRWPPSRAFLEALGAGRRLITLDPRGFGASDRSVPDGAGVVATHASDLADLLDALEVERADLFASIETRCAEAVVFAADNPGRVGRLVLWSPIARLVPYPSNIRTMILNSWQVYTRYAATLIAPSAGEAQRWYTRTIRESTTPEHLDREVSEYVDLAPLLPRVTAPALVLRRSSDQHALDQHVREFGALYPDARVASPGGDAHDLMWQYEQHIELVTSFLDEGREIEAKPVQSTGRSIRIVLFTDLVGHTEMMARLGDSAGRDLLREHERVTREMLSRHGGREVKSLGDGFMAEFESVSGAVDCAIALQRALDAVAESGDARLQIRVGLNAGEPIEEDGDLFGTTVILASRVCALAGPGEILVPEPVRHLLAGKGHTFSQRGQFVPNGFADAVSLYEVKWRP